MIVTVCGSKWRGYIVAASDDRGHAHMQVDGTAATYNRQDAMHEMEDLLVRNPTMLYRPCRCVDCNQDRRERSNP